MLMVVVVLLGAAFGAAMGRDASWLIGAVVAGLLLRSVRQGREIAALKAAMQAGPGAAAGAPTPEVAASTLPATPLPEMPSVVLPNAAALPGAPAMPATETRAAVAVPALVPDAAAIAAPTSAPPASSSPLLDTLKQWFFGGNTIVKAGIGILFIGLAFLAKYASEHVVLPIELRLAGIASVALVLLVLGWRLRLNRPGYAQVLQGGAVAVLYLTLFVAFRFYGVLAGGPVFALMVVVAALAAALAVLQNAPSLAVVGALGGFATPLLVSTGNGNHVALFSYYAVLDLGIAAIAWFRTWRALNLVGFVCTFVIGTAWGVLQYQPDHFATSQAFLVFFFLLFVLVLLLPARRMAAVAAGDAAAGPGARWVNGSLLFGLPTITFVLQYGLVRDMAWGAALSALGLAAFYVALSRLMRRSPRLALPFEASLAIATVFLTLVIPFALDARSTAGAWSLEGAGLLWLGFRQARRLPRLFGYLMLLLAAGAMVHGHVPPSQLGSPWNATLFNALMGAAAALAGAVFVRRAMVRRAASQPAATPRSAEALAEPLLIGVAMLWLLYGAVLQIDAFVPEQQAVAAWVGTFSGITLVLGALAARLRWPMGARPVLALPVLLLLLLATSAFMQRNPLWHGGWGAWPMALAALFFALRAAAPLWGPHARHALHLGAPLVLAGLGALLGRGFTSAWGDAASAWPWLGWLALPALLLMVLPTPALAARWPVAAVPAAWQRDAAGLLSLGGLLWVLLANGASTGSAQPLPHLPLVNPLDLGIALVLFAAWRWWSSVPAAGLHQRQPALGPVLGGGLAFLWLNGMLLRAFHHWGEVPYSFDAWADSLAVQTGLTLLWTTIALGLMWASARRRQRAPWITGAVLLGVVVLKLLLVDQSGSGTVMRIVSFIGVGVLMLVIGYVAPLPTAAVPEKEHAK